MGAGHAHPLYLPGTSPLHRARPQCKIAATLLFAVFLPVVGQGERVEVLGVSLAVGGLWAAWNIVVKGTLGVAASTILAAPPRWPSCSAGWTGCGCRRP